MTMRLLAMLAARGVDPAPICQEAGASAQEVGNPRARVPYRIADALLDGCVRALGCRNFALELARFSDPETYDAAGLVLISSETFGDGLERALAYQRLWADGQRFSFERTPSTAVLRFHHPGPSPTASAILSEVAFVETMLAARTLVAPDVRPLCARFAHLAATGDEDELAQALGVRPSFGEQHSELVLGEELSLGRVRVPEGAVAAVFDLLARRALSALPEAASLAARLEAVLGEDSFKMSLEAAAAYLRMPPRTLQRQLRSEGTSWTELVDGARRRRAHELERRGIPDKEIAYLVGFADPSALARARRRW